MSYWYLILILPAIFIGYIKAVKINHREEIEGFIQILENKQALSQEELQFIREAKDFLNNKEKNIKESINDSRKTD